MEHVEPTNAARANKQLGIPLKERKWVISVLVLTAAVICSGLWSILHMTSAEWHSRSFTFTMKNYGSNARLALFFVLTNYVLLFVIRKRWLAALQKLLVPLAAFARKWHTPVAVLAIGLIVLHAVAALLGDFKLDFHNLTGLLALLSLLPVPVSGLFRYRRLDRKWHLRSGLAFAVLFLIHAFL